MRPILGAMAWAAALAVAFAVRADPHAATYRPFTVSPVANHPVTYSVSQPSQPSHLSQGWGLFATLSGRSTDLDVHDLQWSDDPNVQRNDVEAGYGWRMGATTAVFGYEEHDFGPKYDAASVPDAPDPGRRRLRSSGVLGLSFVIHAP